MCYLKFLLSFFFPKKKKKSPIFLASTNIKKKKVRNIYILFSYYGNIVKIFFLSFFFSTKQINVIFIRHSFTFAFFLSNI